MSDSEWNWSVEFDSLVWGTPGNGAGVFFEDGGNPASPKVGWYFSLAVDGYIKEIATGPFPDKESAMKAAEDQFNSYKKESQ